MNQKHVSHLIDDYIDGVLNAEDRKLVELHIKECSSCQKELLELEAVIHDIQSLPKSIVPPERLQTAINQQLLQYRLESPCGAKPRCRSRQNPSHSLGSAHRSGNCCSHRSWNFYVVFSAQECRS